MTQFVSWLESTAISEMLRDITWVWPLCESLHFMGLCVLIGGAGFFDLRLMGYMPSVPVTTAHTFIRWAIAGFVVNLVTGVLFFVMAPGMYAFSAAWWAKVAFLVVAGVNALAFETTQAGKIAALAPGDDTPMACKVIGALSLFSWFAVLYIGRMLPYIGTGN
jgi:hypothetical protein